MRRTILAVAAGATLAVGAGCASVSDVAERLSPERGPDASARAKPPPVVWHDSEALGLPWAGSLVRGVQLPVEGAHHITWDPIRERVPNRPGRRWGTDDVVRATLGIAARHRRDHPDAPRVTVGDISRRAGGDFGARFGLPGHASHQNGLDVDIYYPRSDARERAPDNVGEVDRRLSQDLVDRFLAAGAAVVFVSRETGLAGPAGMVQYIPNHDTHFHARFGPRRGP